MNRLTPLARRVAAVLGVSGLLVFVGVAPASAAPVPTHGYCGHASSMNWVNGWEQAFKSEVQVNMNTNRYHRVHHYNHFDGTSLYDLHRCH